MIRRRREEEVTVKAEEKILDVDATMQGTLTFRDPVKLKINGNFDGRLITKGSLEISKNAVVNADIDGESISIAGRVKGNIVAQRELRLVSPAHITGNIITPVLSVEPGAILDGNCKMGSVSGEPGTADRIFLSADEVAQYLEIEPNVVAEWASKGRIPAVNEGGVWRIDRKKLDEWIASGRVK